MTNGTAHLAELEETTPVSEGKRIYKSTGGVVLSLRPISRILVRRMERDTLGKPKPPIVETEVGPKKVKVKESNPEDPDYKAALALWNEDHSERMLIYVLFHGVVEGPSAEEIELLKDVFPGENAMGIKYAWLNELIPNENEIGELSRIIIGQTLPTAEGINDAEARFPGDSERSADRPLSATTD